MTDIGSIRAIYQTNNLTGSGYGIEGYFVQNKYFDANKIKQQRLYASKQKSSSSKPLNITQKKTFIDQIQKKSSKLPGPTTYQLKQYSSKSKTQSIIHPGNRKTIFDDIQYNTKKANFPAPIKYSIVETEVDKTKLKSNLSKADNSNFFQSSMRNSLDAPGVGNYIARGIFGEKKGYKWIESKNKSKSEAKTKLPPVGTYDPKPAQYNLFSSLASLEKGRSKSSLAKTERFKSPRQKDIPFYNVLSQWGMKDKRNKKDILSKITKTAGYSSVYY